MSFPIPASLKLTVPLILLGFAATLSTVNLLYHVPEAEKAVEIDGRKRLAQEISRLQSTLEYLMLKGDLTAAQREIAVQAHNHDVTLAALTDDRDIVIAATRRAWLGREMMDVLPRFAVEVASDVHKERGAGMTIDSDGDELLGHARILMGSEREQLRPSRAGSVLLAYDLRRYKAEARGLVIKQSLYWAGWVTALALVMWLVFHFLLTRRTARLVHAAEQLAAGNLAARSGLRGRDELGRLGRAFDAMALDVAQTQTRLQEDIVERARVQRELENSEARLHQILNNATAVIAVKDTTGRILFVNRQWERLFGQKRETVVGKTDAACLPAGIAASLHANDQLVLQRNAPMEFEESVPQRDGVRTYISVKFPLRDANGVAYAVCGISTDITDRKLADAALRASEEQYHAMFNASIDGLALWDAAGRIVETNPALRRMYGHEDGDPAHEGAAPWPGPSYSTEFLRAVAEGEPLHVDVAAVRADGSPLDLEVHGVPMHYQGQPHVLTIARDVTERKRSAEELQRQRESLYQREKLAALGSLLAGVAHELNNPLSVVVARAVMLEEHADPAIGSAALKIRTAAERCARIVRTFLAMARQQRPERGAVAVNDVISAALDITSYAIRTSSIELELSLAKDLPPLLADADQLHQVVLNLVINAQQSLQEQPLPRRIAIESRYDAHAGAVRITVADNGPGIPAAVRARIFEPYFTTKPVGVGTGVGLAVSLGIVEAHGGTLSVDCPPRGGAVFTIALPVADAVAPDGPVAPLHQAGAKALRVLVVDDEPDIREALADILQGAGHQVSTASSGRDALQRLERERYDAILTDVRMPGLDGRDLYREIERAWPALASRVAFVTGDTLASSLREFVSHSGRPVIEKPFLPVDVRRVVVELASAADA
jgi:PAS domain S-box-containing protein